METEKVNLDNSILMDQAYLLPINQDQSQVLKVGDFVTIGRDTTNSLQLIDPFVSSRHVRIEKRNRGYLLRDLQSRNGTFLNGTSVIEAYLSNNDKILIGESAFIFSKVHHSTGSLVSKNK